MTDNGIEWWVPPLLVVLGFIGGFAFVGIIAVLGSSRHHDRISRKCEKIPISAKGSGT